MAIKILRKGLPVCGHAKIGFNDQKKKGAPSKFDHIELTGMARDRSGNLIPNVDLMLRLVHAGAKTCGGCDRSKQLADLCGIPEFDKGLPVELGIMLPYDDMELNFPHRLAYFRGRTAYCIGDGEEAKRLEILGTETVKGRTVHEYGNAKRHTPCGNECPDFESRRCKPQARLRFILAGQESIGGCYEFRTTSWNSIANIEEALGMVRQLSAGIVRWIPLFFEISAQTVQPKGNAPPNTAYIARVEYRGTPESLLQTVERTLSIQAPLLKEVKLLEASLSRDWTMTDQEVDEFRSEFDHENMQTEFTRGETETGKDEGEESAHSTQESPDPEPEAVKGSPPREAAPPSSDLPPLTDEIARCQECGVPVDTVHPPECSLASEQPPPIGDPSPPEAGFEGDFEPLCIESKHQLWNACKVHGDRAADCLRAVLDQFSYATSNDAAETELPALLKAVEKWGK